MISREALRPAAVRARAGSVKFRALVLWAVGWLALAWTLFLLAGVSGAWQLAFPAVLLAAWGVGRDLSEEGYFHPVLVFGFVSLATVLVGMSWLAVFMGGEIPFFSGYAISATPENLLLLAGQQMLLFTMSYLGYLVVRGPGLRRVESLTPRVEPVDRLWFVFYAIGLAALLAYAFSLGGFGALLENLSNRGEARAGRGALVLLYLVAYAGVLLWYKKNLPRPAWWRYGGLVLLFVPLLFFGARSSVLSILFGVLFMDERVGRRMSLKTVLALGVSLMLFFSVYLAFRGGTQLNILRSVYLDLSMGTGFLVAFQQGFFDGQLRLDLLWLVVAVVMPGGVDAALGVPESPNDLFTRFLYPNPGGFSASMGVMGEAWYYLPFGWSFLHYFLIGIVLAWVGNYAWKRSLVFAAVAAGAAWRIVKTGLFQSASTVVIFFLPIALAYIALMMISRLIGRPREEPDH